MHYLQQKFNKITPQPEQGTESNKYSNLKELPMSWFKRIPPRYPPKPAVTTPYRSSPAVDLALEQAKEIGLRSHKNVKKSRPINKE